MMQPRMGIGFAMFALGLACTPNTSSGGGTETGEASGTMSEGGTEDGSTGSSACALDQDAQVTWANQGTLVPPMELGFADILGIDVARSGTSEMGTVTMAFTTTCDGPLHLWALVWDSIGGETMDNADSIYVSVDGGEEQAWLYGCHSEEGVNTQWRWLPVEAWTMTQCDHAAFVIDSLPAGEHSIVVRGREGGSGGIDVAAIAAVVVSHDPQTDPAPFFEIPEP